MTAPEEFTQRRYRCPHCRKSWSQKGRAILHMLRGCHRDPRTATCSTCKHYQRGYGPSWEEPGRVHDCDAGVDILDVDVVELPRHCQQWAER